MECCQACCCPGGAGGTRKVRAGGPQIPWCSSHLAAGCSVVPSVPQGPCQAGPPRVPESHRVRLEAHPSLSPKPGGDDGDRVPQGLHGAARGSLCSAACRPQLGGLSASPPDARALRACQERAGRELGRELWPSLGAVPSADVLARPVGDGEARPTSFSAPRRLGFPRPDGSRLLHKCSCIAAAAIPDKWAGGQCLIPPASSHTLKKGFLNSLCVRVPTCSQRFRKTP